MSSLLRFFEILQNFDSEIDCMTLEGTISLLISQVNVSERAMLRFSDSCVCWRLFDLKYF